MKGMTFADHHTFLNTLLKGLTNPEYEETDPSLRFGDINVYVFTPDWRMLRSSLTTNARERKALLLNGYHLKATTPNKKDAIAILTATYEVSSIPRNMPEPEPQASAPHTLMFTPLNSDNLHRCAACGALIGEGMYIPSNLWDGSDDEYTCEECFETYMNREYGEGNWRQVEDDGWDGFYEYCAPNTTDYVGTGIYYTTWWGGEC